MPTWPEKPGRSRKVYLMYQDGPIRREISPLTKLEFMCQLHNGRYKVTANAHGRAYGKLNSGWVSCDAKSEQRVAPDACRAGNVLGMEVKATAGHALPDDFEIQQLPAVL